MDFKFSEEHLAFRDMAAEFARNQLAPGAAAWDEQAYFPIEVMRQAAALGMAGIVCGEDIGGANLTRLDAAIIFVATGLRLCEYQCLSLHS